MDPTRQVVCRDKVAQTRELVPSFGIESNIFRRQQLLKRPAAREPAAVAKLRLRESTRGRHADIVEMDVASAGLGIPLEHGVDCLAQFSRAGLVDAVGVGPKPIEAVAFRLFASAEDLENSLLCTFLKGFPAVLLLFGICTDGLPFLKRRLFLAPGMRKDRVRRDIVAKELVEPESGGVDQAHRGCNKMQAFKFDMFTRTSSEVGHK